MIIYAVVLQFRDTTSTTLCYYRHHDKAQAHVDRLHAPERTTSRALLNLDPDRPAFVQAVRVRD